MILLFSKKVIKLNLYTIISSVCAFELTIGSLKKKHGMLPLYSEKVTWYKTPEIIYRMHYHLWTRIYGIYVKAGQ